MTQPVCTETTASGQPCRNLAMLGSTMCASHVGRARRPSLLTDEVAARLVTMLRAGNYLQVAARAVGVTPKTLREWIARGASDAPEDERYRALRESVEQARAEGEARNVARIAQAAQTSWQAAAWLLERQYPQRWARPAVVDRSEQPVADRDETPAATSSDDDPFAEIDELAARRRQAGA